MEDYKFIKVSISRKKTQLWTLMLTVMPLSTGFFNSITDSISNF